MGAYVQLSPILRGTDDGGKVFFCPGCNEVHIVRTGDGPGPRWGWNGDVDRPTFEPSVLVTTGRRVDPSFVPEPGDPPECCHSFVREGRIQFLGDCTHALAGQTVELPPWPSR